MSFRKWEVFVQELGLKPESELFQVPHEPLVCGAKRPSQHRSSIRAVVVLKLLGSSEVKYHEVSMGPEMCIHEASTKAAKREVRSVSQTSAFKHLTKRRD